MVGGCPVPGVYTRGVAPNPAAITAMQKQIKQKELEHQQQQEKIKKEYLFQEQKQRLKTMTGKTKFAIISFLRLDGRLYILSFRYPCLI